MTLALRSASGLIACLSLSHAAFAYDWETSFSIQDQESADPTIGVGVRYYFDPLTHGTSTPWNEIAFVERAAETGGSISYDDQTRVFELEFGPLPGTEIRSKTKTTTLTYDLIYRAPESKHAFGGSIDYARVKGRSSSTAPSFIGEFDFDAYNFSLGYEYYLNRTWTVGAGVSFFDSDLDIDDPHSFSVQTKRIWELGKRRWFVTTVEANLQQISTELSNQETWTFDFGGEFYFDEKTSLGGSVGFNDQINVQIYSASLSRYFDDAFFGELGVRWVDDNASFTFPDTETPNGTLVQLRLGTRF